MIFRNITGESDDLLVAKNSWITLSELYLT